MAYREYKPETEFTEINAAEAEWTPWRIDAAGVQWYSRSSRPDIGDNNHDGGCEFYELNADGERVLLEGMQLPGEIRGVPAPVDDAIEADDDDTDDECVCRDEDGNIFAGAVPPVHLPATGEVKFTDD